METQARAYIRQYPVPTWINRDSPLYRGWELFDNTWEGEQTLGELGLTAEPEQEHMTRTPSPIGTTNPPSPYSHGPPPNTHERGTLRNRPFIMAPKDQARNYRGQFARQDNEVSVTSKEATAVTFAAAALTHMAENPGLYPAEWNAGAKTNKAAILSLATKVNQGAEGTNEPQSPAEVLRRLNLRPGPTTPSRKRHATINLVDDDEDRLVYNTAPKFGGTNPFESPAKKQANNSRSEKANPAAVATLLETKEFYRDMTTFMSRFGRIANLEFDPRCPAVEDFLAGRPAQRDDMLAVAGAHVAVVFLHDKYTTACLFPAGCIDGLMKAVTTLRAADPENKTDQVPVCFVLHALLRLDRDFGVVKIRYTEDDRIDKLVTIAAWKNKYAASLDATSIEEMRRRVAGLVGYVKDHGVVKCHALTDREPHEWQLALSSRRLSPNATTAAPGEKSNFEFTSRLPNTNLDGKQKVVYALTKIKGVGRRYSNLVCKKGDVDLNKRAGELTSKELKRIVTIIQNLTQYKIPAYTSKSNPEPTLHPRWWNHARRDIVDGKDSQVPANGVDFKLRDDLKCLKKIRAHHDLRHY
ncbi:hypothetical protein INS49_011981 [Diaporthe citri]|uniref:uncharacterized protein n=1 Tax=Diaporthe citri TaxID=83186 RepID=UPI001C7F7430|nr:uncharacterized protein INS49_011981 [Diaporthe citri]KAG6360913.1 hypothetical protein INS49_011981 [Diaporthe citri]